LVIRLNTNPTTNIVVLHSGGLDSTVCLLLARAKGNTVLSLGFDYAQRHRIELDFAANQCAKYQIPRRVLKIEWNKPQRDVPLDRNPEEMRLSVSPAFLPGRNMVFLSLGAAEAAALGATELWTGVNSVDFSGYPDCRPEFIEAFGRMLVTAIPRGPKVIAPLQLLSKQQIAGEAKRLGLGSHDTWSCYRPVYGSGVVSPCGRCDACRLHELAWKTFEHVS
jgi:7-cyano-7-deazaguanine synthase